MGNISQPFSLYGPGKYSKLDSWGRGLSLQALLTLRFPGRVCWCVDTPYTWFCFRGELGSCWRGAWRVFPVNADLAYYSYFNSSVASHCAKHSESWRHTHSSRTTKSTSNKRANWKNARFFATLK